MWLKVLVLCLTFATVCWAGADKTEMMNECLQQFGASAEGNCLYLDIFKFKIERNST